MRPCPDTLPAFEAKYAQICAEQLEMTPAADRAIDMALHQRLELPYLPPILGSVLGAPATPVVRLATIGGLPRAVRTRFHIPWSNADKHAYAALVMAVKNSGRLLPDRAMNKVMEHILKQVGSATYLTSEKSE